MPRPDRPCHDDAGHLPVSLAVAVRECVDASGLGGNARAALTRELSAHMRDALEAGKPEQLVLREFGNAALAGAMIRRVRGPVRHVLPRRLATGLASLGAATMAMVYAVSTVTLHAHAPAIAPTAAERDRVQRLAESPVDLDATSRVVRALLDQMYSHDGTLTADGLRIVQRLKGVERMSTVGLVAEAAFFALPASRAAVDREWQRVAHVIASARAGGPGSPAWRALELEVERFSWARRDGYRYVPLAIVLPRIVAALRNEANRVAHGLELSAVSHRDL